MNITAAINLLSNNCLGISSLRTSEAIDISGGIASITEALKITVPSVLEIQLSPADVDIVSI